MKLYLEKPWIGLNAENVHKIPGQLGVYEVADSDGNIQHIGFAGARELFGLRSALERELATRASGYRFRYEVNTQYQTRWRELLMLYRRDHGDLLPPGNAAGVPKLGRLSPG